MVLKKGNVVDESVKYSVIRAASDYDCGAPWTNLVGGKLYDSWNDAYDAMIADMCKVMEVGSIDELGKNGEDYGVPDKSEVGRYTHKCATAWAHNDDGEILWDIARHV